MVCSEIVTHRFSQTGESGFKVGPALGVVRFTSKGAVAARSLMSRKRRKTSSETLTTSGPAVIDI